MFSERFRLIKQSQSFQIFKNCLKFDIYFPNDYEQIKNAPDVFSAVTDAMSVGCRMKFLSLPLTVGKAIGLKSWSHIAEFFPIVYDRDKFSNR